MMEFLVGMGTSGVSTGVRTTGEAIEALVAAHPDRHRLPVTSCKCVVCNAGEGDPGAFMDRFVLEGDPHAVLEDKLVCGHAIGAEHGHISRRPEYPLPILHLELAIAATRARGYLGRDLLGTGKALEIEQGAGAFVCGEETALSASFEGERGAPRIRPPFRAEARLSRPTNNNDDGVSPCQDACPAGEDAQGYRTLVATGRDRPAAQRIREVNPLPVAWCWHRRGERWTPRTATAMPSRLEGLGDHVPAPPTRSARYKRALHERGPRRLRPGGR